MEWNLGGHPSIQETGPETEGEGQDPVRQRPAQVAYRAGEAVRRPPGPARDRVPLQPLQRREERGALARAENLTSGTDLFNACKWR